MGLIRTILKSGTDRGLLSAIDQVIETLKTLWGGHGGGHRCLGQTPKSCVIYGCRLTAFEAAKAHKETFPSGADDYGDDSREVLEHGLAMEERDLFRCSDETK